MDFNTKIKMETIIHAMPNGISELSPPTPTEFSSGFASLKYLDNFLRLCYYIGICPNKYELSLNGHYEAWQDWFQKLVCFLFAFLTFLVRIYEMRLLKGEGTDYQGHGHDDHLEVNPEIYFLYARKVGELFYAIAIFYAFWFNTKNIVTLLNIATRFTKKKRSQGGNHRFSKFITYNWLGRNQVTIWMTICGIYIGISLATEYLLDVEKSSWNNEELLEEWNQYGRGLLFVPINAKSGNQTHDHIRVYSIADMSFIVFNVLACYAEDVYFAIGDMFLLISSILLLVYFQEFGSKLGLISEEFALDPSIEADDEHPETSNINFSDLLQEFDTITQIMNGLNHVIGIMVLGLTLASFPFFVTDFLKLLNFPSTMTLVSVILYFAHLMAFMILAALVNRKAQALQNWMRQRKNYLLVKQSGTAIGAEEIIAIQQGKNVGIHVAGFFIITPEFIGSWISLLLTFVIVIMEIRSMS